MNNDHAAPTLLVLSHRWYGLIWSTRVPTCKHLPHNKFWLVCCNASCYSNCYSVLEVLPRLIHNFTSRTFTALVHDYGSLLESIREERGHVVRRKYSSRVRTPRKNVLEYSGVHKFVRLHGCFFKEPEMRLNGSFHNTHVIEKLYGTRSTNETASSLFCSIQ